MMRNERKMSHCRETQPTIPSVDFAGDESNDSVTTEWVYTPIAKYITRFFSMMSLISVSANTPDTFRRYPILFYVTYVIDAIVSIHFTAEMLAKIRIKGAFKPSPKFLLKSKIPGLGGSSTDSKRPKAYFRRVWGIFDSVMVAFLLISFGISSFELSSILTCPDKMQLEVCDEVTVHWRSYGYLSIFRCPRPLILMRMFRAVFKLQLPKSRVSAIFQRSTQQVYNVTVFLLFFMSLYGILGVQFFGEDLNYHCVLNTTNTNDVTIADLAIPDSYCNPFGTSDYSCPSNMNCIIINSSAKDEGNYAGFEAFHVSFFTVYQAASQEGWVFIMYRAMDCLPSWKGVIYFISMIFFLAWLVKNVFIAVLIETFAEIRVQFQQMWTPRSTADADSSKIFQSDGVTWKLVPVNESKPKGLAPKFFQETILKSTAFNVIIMLLVLANALNATGLHFNHNKGEQSATNKNDGFYITEIVFTCLFNLEALFKIWCLGWKSYWQRSLHKYESVLCVGTTLHCIPKLYRTQFTYFQVLRIVRLIKASPMLEDFCFKIFGPGKKLGTLILFTMCLLVITSSISLQLFCFIKENNDKFNRFATFPMAFMSMFQILTQKGWVSVMHNTMNSVHDETLTGLIAIYFVFYHLFVTLIVLSLFVAVILDNLELDEDIKKLKQLKLREMSAETQQKLPMRLRIFEKFPNRPQMIKLTRILSDFILPRIRDSFMRQFALSPDDTTDDEETDLEIHDALGGRRNVPTDILNKVRLLKGDDKKSAIIYLINESNKTRMLSAEQPVSGPTRSLLSTQHQIRTERRSMRNRAGANQVAGTKARENGDIGGAGMNSNRNGKGPGSDHYDIKVLQQKAKQAEIKRNQQEEDLRENHPFFDKPLFAVGRESRFREVCRLLVEARYKDDLVAEVGENSGRRSQCKSLLKLIGLVCYLDWLMIIITTVSCASMMFETPFKRVSNTWHLKIAEYIFFVAMSIEMTLKILANGFFFTPQALVRDFAGVLDLFIYIMSLINVSYMMRVETVGPASGMQVLMILRCLRPLRIFCLVPHMRRVVYELVRGFREILMVSVLLVVNMFIFAVYGVNLFGGKLAICNDRSKTTKDECVGVFSREISVTKIQLSGSNPTMVVPRVWANPRNFNFDNIGNAMLTLFEVMSLEGWVEIRDVIKDRVGPLHAIYIHLFVFIGCMIGLTLFVGVVIANYSENKGTALLTVDQRRWLDLKGRIKLTQPLHIPPRPKMRQEPGRSSSAPVNENSLANRFVKLRCFMYDITQNIIFKRITASLVLVNCCLLYFPWNSAEGSDDDRRRTKILAGLSVTCTILFCFDVYLKIMALSFCGYWQSRRNRFDMLVTVLGVVWIFVHFCVEEIGPNRVQSNNFGWVVVVLRFFTITGKHVTLKMLMLTVLMSMMKSFFIITGMFLLMLVYALAGVILFGTVKYGDDLGRHANFHNTFRAIALLCRIVTGEDWNKIMHDCMVQPPFCVNKENFWETNCGNFQAALIYFCSFYIIITYIMLNVLVAIIMENFSLFYSNDEDAIISYSDIRAFQLAWNYIDVNRKGMVKAYYVRFLLRLIPRDRVGFDFNKKKDQQIFKEMCYEVEMLRGGRDKEVSFHDVLNMLAYRTVEISKTLQLEELIAREELEYAIEEEVARQTIATWIERCIFRNRQKHGNLKFSLRSDNDRQALSTAEDDDFPLSQPPGGRKISSVDPLGLVTPDTDQTGAPLGSGAPGSDSTKQQGLPASVAMGFKRRRSVKTAGATLPEVAEDSEEQPAHPTSILLNSPSYSGGDTSGGTGGTTSRSPNGDEECLGGSDEMVLLGSSVTPGVGESQLLTSPGGSETSPQGSGLGLVAGSLDSKPAGSCSAITQIVHSGCEEVKDWWKSQLMGGGRDNSNMRGNGYGLNGGYEFDSTEESDFEDGL